MDSKFFVESNILTTGMSSLSSHMVLIIRGSAIPAALRQSGRKRSGEISLFHINTNFFYSSEGDAQMCTQIPHSNGNNVHMKVLNQLLLHQYGY